MKKSGEKITALFLYMIIQRNLLLTFLNMSHISLLSLFQLCQIILQPRPGMPSAIASICSHPS